MAVELELRWLVQLGRSLLGCASVGYWNLGLAETTLLAEVESVSVGYAQNGYAAGPSPHNSLEERLHTIEGGDKYELEAIDLCLVLDVGLPTNFKTPEFDKYKGSSCPGVHLAMYCQKMAAYIYDDKVLIHYFQDNLTGATLSWYVSLERGRIKTWRDLVEAFLK
ncbi:hypothetical protein CR513_29818, partial [Mucuna pruriens]